jgi:23S rRNA maturation mini-RNase III
VQGLRVQRRTTQGVMDMSDLVYIKATVHDRVPKFVTIFSQSLDFHDRDDMMDAFFEEMNQAMKKRGLNVTYERSSREEHDAHYAPIRAIMAKIIAAKL